MPLPPVATVYLFPGERTALLRLLRELEPDDGNAPTVRDGWNAHDVALHLLGSDIGWLSGGRRVVGPPQGHGLERPPRPARASRPARHNG